MEALSRRIALVHHKLHFWDNAIGKALTEDPLKLHPNRIAEHRISQHINPHFFSSHNNNRDASSSTATGRRQQKPLNSNNNGNSNENLFSSSTTGGGGAFAGVASSSTSTSIFLGGSREATGRSLRLTKKKSEEALSEMLKSVARLGVSGAMNQELDKERTDVSRCCLLLLQLETWLDIAGGNDFMAVPHHHLGAVNISTELLEDCYKVVRLRFPTAMDPYDLLLKIESDLDGMIELLAWTCAIDRRLLAVDAGFARMIDICCSVRVRKAVSSERESFVATFDQAAQTQRTAIAKLLAGYTVFLGSSTPSYSVIGSRFDAVCHAKRLAALSVNVPHSLTVDAVASSLQIIFAQFQKQVPESLTLLVDPLAPDEILGMGKSARDPANRGTVQYGRDTKVVAAWKRIQNHEVRNWSKRSTKRSGAAGRFTSILILQRAWRNYAACRDAVTLCAALAMVRMQKRAIGQIVSWWRRRKQFWEMREVKLQEAGLRRAWVKEELKKYVRYCHYSASSSALPGVSITPTTTADASSVGNQQQRNYYGSKNGGILLSTLTSATSTRLLSAVVDEIPVDDEDDEILEEDEEEADEDDHVNVTVSSIHESEKEFLVGSNKNSDSLSRRRRRHIDEEKLEESPRTSKRRNRQQQELPKTPGSAAKQKNDESIISNSNVHTEGEEASSSSTPWRNVPVRWKQHQRDIYQKHQNINFYQHVVSSSPPPPSSAQKAVPSSSPIPSQNKLINSEKEEEQEQDSSLIFSNHLFLHHQQFHQQHSLLHPALASPSRAQKNSMIFCAARRIQSFFMLVRFVRQTERKWAKRREPSIPISEIQNNYNNYSHSLPPMIVSGSAAFGLLTRNRNRKGNVKSTGDSTSTNLQHQKQSISRPSSATSSVLEKFRRIRREQQNLGDNYRWESGSSINNNINADKKSKQNTNNENAAGSSTPHHSSSSSSSTFSLSASSNSDEEVGEIFDPIQRSLSRSSYISNEEDEDAEERKAKRTKRNKSSNKRKSQEIIISNNNNNTNHNHHHTLDRLTFHSLKTLSRQQQQSLQEPEPKPTVQSEKNINSNNNVDDDDDAAPLGALPFTPSSHLLHKLSSIPTVFKIAQKGDGNVLVRPGNSNNHDHQQDADSEHEDSLTFDEAEFRKHILAQTGKTQISQQELEMHKRIAEKYLQNVERLEGHRSDEIALAAMRGDASKLLLSSVCSVLVGKNHFQAFANSAFDKMKRADGKKSSGCSILEDDDGRSRWIVEELRETVAKLRNHQQTAQNEKKHRNAKKMQRPQNGDGEGRVLSSDDDIGTADAHNKTAAASSSMKQDNNKPKHSLQLLSPIHNSSGGQQRNEEQVQEPENKNKMNINDESKKLCGLNPVETPLVSFRIPQQQLRHPYQNWSNATQVLRTIVRRGIQELVAILKTQDLRNMFQFSEEELYRKEVVITKRRIKKRKNPQHDDDSDNSDDRSPPNSDRSSNNSINNRKGSIYENADRSNDDDDDDDKYEEIEEEEERFVVDEMALAKQRAQAVELTLQLLCETVNASSLNDAIAILSTDISKLVEDENLPIVSILRTSLALESRRLIVPWIIITGAGKEFRDFDPEVKRRHVDREIHEANVKAQKQRRSRRNMEKDLRHQQFVVEYQRKMREREAEIQRLIQAKEERIVERKARRIERKKNRLTQKKDHAEQKKVRAMLRDIRKEKKKFEKAEKEKQKSAEVAAASNKENAKVDSSKKPSSSSPPPPRVNSAGKSPAKPTNTTITSPAPKKQKNSTTNTSNNNDKSNDKQQQQESTTQRSASSVSSVSSASSSISSSASSSSTTSYEFDSKTGKPIVTLSQEEVPPLPKQPQDQLREFEQEEEERKKIVSALLKNKSSNNKNVSPASSATLDSSFGGSVNDENDNDDDDEEQKISFLEESEQIEFDDEAVVMSNCDDEFILTFDDLERIKYHQFLNVAVANCNLKEFFVEVMNGPHSLVAKWLKIPNNVKKNNELMKRRIDLMLLGSLLLPFLKTLQQWFNSNFAFDDGTNDNNNQNDEHNHQNDEEVVDDDEEEEDNDRQEGNHEYHHHHHDENVSDVVDDDDEDDQEGIYLQNETFDEEILVRQSGDEDVLRSNHHQVSSPSALPQLVGTGRGDASENEVVNSDVNNNNHHQHHHNHLTVNYYDDEDQVELASRQESNSTFGERPEARLGSRNEDHREDSHEL